MSAATRSVGLDIGGTKTAAIVIDGTGGLGASVELPTEGGNEGALRTAERAVRMLAERSDCASDEFSSIGVGVPGLVERESGEVRHAYNIGVESLALGPLLSERTGTRVALENDVTAAAVGAARLMDLAGSVAYLNLGTGLSAGIVLDGRPVRGAHGLAGEIGHLPISPRLRPCPCGQLGCLETVASGAALKRYWPAGGEHPGWSLASSAANGDAEAALALEMLIEGAAAAVSTLALTMAPETIVIGGGLRKIGAPLIEGISARLDRQSEASPFLGRFEMSRRLRVMPDGLPAATVGAALSPGL